MQLRLLILLLLFSYNVYSIEYAYKTMEPQVSGWPLSEKELTYLLKPEHERRPGIESQKYLPKLWPLVPTAGFWGGTSWLDTHSKLVDYIKLNPGPCDVLLIGDSITQQWGSPLDEGTYNSAWSNNFKDYKTLNIGIGGDKIQNVLWRIDHGGVEGIQPKVIILMIGNNNMFFAPETGVQAIVNGIKVTLGNLREKFPTSSIIVTDILPAHNSENAFHKNILKTNELLNECNLGQLTNVHYLKLAKHFIQEDGEIIKELFMPDEIHLSIKGYEVYASKLKKVLKTEIGNKGLGHKVKLPKKKSASLNNPPKTKSYQVKIENGRIVYPYPPYNQGLLDPQLEGWPLNKDMMVWVEKPEYHRKPGSESHKHLPDMWFTTPTAAHWDKGEGRNQWIKHHEKNINRSKQFTSKLDVVLIGDSITQGWGGSWETADFNPVWNKYFKDLKTLNLGIGGDRIENILWRLDHGALDGLSPKYIILMIGVNNAPLIYANGASIDSAVLGIELCLKNIHLRCPDSNIILIKTLPAFDPLKEVGKVIVKLNEKINKFNNLSYCKIIDYTNSFTDKKGRLISKYYSDGHLHLNLEGYEVIAKKLKSEIAN